MVTPDDMARSGVIVTLAHRGAQIERGLLSSDAASASLTTVATNSFDVSQPTERKQRACQRLAPDTDTLLAMLAPLAGLGIDAALQDWAIERGADSDAAQLAQIA